MVFSQSERDKYNLNQGNIFKTPEEEEEYSKKNKKKCIKCCELKPLVDYSTNCSGKSYFDKYGYRYRRGDCKECVSKAGANRKKVKDEAKKSGISLIAPEGSICAICKKPPTSGNNLVFDHNHNFNIFRGYIHDSCNRALGCFGDNIQGLCYAFNYLNVVERKKILQDKITFEITTVPTIIIKGRRKSF
jgi:hypothetical protein